MNPVNGMMLGAIAMSSFAIAAFFLRFWRRGRDTFFLLFALSFIVEGVNRIAQALSENPNEGTLGRYSVRLLAFLLILAAIAIKNRERR
jgi:uncharacterized membrane protein HdeD (DUF308 family)